MKGSHTHTQLLGPGGKGMQEVRKAAVCLGVKQMKHIKHLLRLCSDFMTMGGSH